MRISPPVKLTCTINCQQKSITTHPPPPPRWECKALRADTCIGERRWKPCSGASLWPDQKAWGAAHSAATGPLLCWFLVVSLGGRGSKLVTVSFCLQSWAFRLAGGGGRVPCWDVEEEPPPPPSFPSHGLQTPERNKKAGQSCHFPHIFSTTRA